MGYGEPNDVDGECNAHLYIADNFGDNHATIRCGLPYGHLGPHNELFSTRAVKVFWEKDERTDGDKSE